jgi:hypothetical protein
MVPFHYFNDLVWKFLSFQNFKLNFGRNTQSVKFTIEEYIHNSNNIIHNLDSIGTWPNDK